MIDQYFEQVSFDFLLIAYGVTAPLSRAKVIDELSSSGYDKEKLMIFPVSEYKKDDIRYILNRISMPVCRSLVRSTNQRAMMFIMSKLCYCTYASDVSRDNKLNAVRCATEPVIWQYSKETLELITVCQSEIINILDR